MIVVTVARRPLSGSVASTVQEHGTGAINVDASRVMLRVDDDIIAKNPHTVGGFGHGNAGVYGAAGTGPGHYDPAATGGRWPANLVLEHRPGCRQAGTAKVKNGVAGTGGGFRSSYVSGEIKDNEQARKTWGTFNGPDGFETVVAWACEPGCPVAELDSVGSSRSGGRVPGDAPSNAMGGDVFGSMGRVEGPEPYGDKGGASRFFKQVGGQRS